MQITAGDIRKIIAQNIGVAFLDCDDEKTLAELGATETDVTEVIIALEEVVETSLDDDLVTSEHTVADIIKYTMEACKIGKGEETDGGEKDSGGSGTGGDKE